MRPRTLNYIHIVVSMSEPQTDDELVYIHICPYTYVNGHVHISILPYLHAMQHFNMLRNFDVTSYIGIWRRKDRKADSEV